MINREFDVALSFAGEDREAAKELAATLMNLDIKVFYDEYEKANLWGVDLYDHLTDVYQHRARYCVMFLSEYYAKKLWTNHERKAAQARAFQENHEYILPIRLDDTTIPGILPTVGYLRWQDETAESIARMLMVKLGKSSSSNSAISDEASGKNKLNIEFAETELKRTRKLHLQEHLAKDSALLKQYEDSLRLEDDPRRLVRYKREIERIKSSMADYERELGHLN